jgi:hypothetical protein
MAAVADLTNETTSRASEQIDLEANGGGFKCKMNPLLSVSK